MERFFQKFFGVGEYDTSERTVRINKILLTFFFLVIIYLEMIILKA